MAFSGEDEEFVGDSQRIERVFEEIVFQHCDSDVVSAGNHVRGRFDFVDLEDGGFVVVALLGFPGTSAEEVGVVIGCVVVAPVANVLDGSGSGDGGLEAGGLGDEPVGHVSAVAVAADGEAVGVGDAVFHQRVDAGENVFAGTRDELRERSA